eukprot:TRINITY_DN6781_c0_g1_i1.p1 TRINITY_DN6781_c0_g1~~TRINITY_DN6781_c0_g1_i1.p1  ORF type:complete len:232 (-),score=51.63 TRINITY_DN6781_c0_g1_i1:72-767(-)
MKCNRRPIFLLSLSSHFVLSQYLLLSFFLVANSVPLLRGVHPKDASRYSAVTYKCKGGERSLPRHQLNDDFCDCPLHGDDEPGTSACSEGKFFCPRDEKFISSSLVDDHFCDCCDGSDETLMTCPFTCQAGAIESDKREMIVKGVESGGEIGVQLKKAEGGSGGYFESVDIGVRKESEAGREEASRQQPEQREGFRWIFFPFLLFFVLFLCQRVFASRLRSRRKPLKRFSL